MLARLLELARTQLKRQKPSRLPTGHSAARRRRCAWARSQQARARRAWLLLLSRRPGPSAAALGVAGVSCAGRCGLAKERMSRLRGAAPPVPEETWRTSRGEPLVPRKMSPQKSPLPVDALPTQVILRTASGRGACPCGRGCGRARPWPAPRAAVAADGEAASMRSTISMAIRARFMRSLTVTRRLIYRLVAQRASRLRLELKSRNPIRRTSFAYAPWYLSTYRP